LQLADSAFPSGGFAHSAGLEAATQLGEVRGEAGVARFLSDALWQAGHGSLPLVGDAWRRPGDVATLDAVCDAFVLGAVANRASRVQGRAFVSACARSFDDPALVTLHDDVRARRIAGHHAPLFGAAARALGVSHDDATVIWLHGVARGVLSAAVRLGLVGPHEAQGMQHGTAALRGRIAGACGALGRGDLAQTSPWLDLLGSQHDHLYSRLFQS
jgi:urease accessory protein